MPGFLGHTVANTAVLVGTTVVMRAQSWSWQDVIAVDAGIAIATFVLSPDMDLFNSKSMDGWGWLRVFWWPYSKLAKHRDRLHIPILGTAVRWLYVLTILAILGLLLYLLLRRLEVGVHFDFIGNTQDLLYNALYLADVFLGAILADTTHYVLDIISTKIKRLIPRRFRERYDRYARNHYDHDHRPPRGQTWIPLEDHR
jgi:uncharacterized metal-binding protein